MILCLLAALTLRQTPTGPYPELQLGYGPSTAKIAAEIQKEYSNVAPALWKLLDQKPDLTKPIKLSLIEGVGGDGFTVGGLGGLSQMFLTNYGSFPKRRYEMARRLCEAAWGLGGPGPNVDDPLWGDGLREFICIEACRRSGYFNEGTVDLRNRFKAGMKLDPKFVHSDLAKTSGIPEALRTAKGLFILEQLSVRYSKDFVIHYFRAKRRLIPEGKPYTTDDLTAVVSYTAGMDQFRWMKQHGISVSKDHTSVPIN